MNIHVDWSLLLKYFQERCSEDELRQIEKWLGSDPEHQRFFEEMGEIWKKSGDLYENFTVDTVAAWEKLTTNLSLGSDVHKKTIIFGSSFLRWAAIIIALLGIGAVMVLHFKKHDTLALVNVIQSGNEKMDICLPDSSTVTLNRNTQLQYPANFNGDRREVKLKGTAYFTIKPNTKKPFVVTMSGCAVRVVGTVFYLNSDSVSNKIVLIVVSGKVHFYSNSKNSAFVEVSKNEKAVYINSKQEIVKEKTYSPNDIVWKTGNFIFEAEKLQNVCHILSTYYAKNIQLSDSSLLDLRLTAGFHEQSLPDILEAIETTLDVNLTMVGEKIVISKK